MNHMCPLENINVDPFDDKLFMIQFSLIRQVYTFFWILNREMIIYMFKSYKRHKYSEKIGLTSKIQKVLVQPYR